MENIIIIREAAKMLGIKTSILRYHIEEGNIESIDGKIHKSVCDKIAKQQENYIGIKDFLKRYDSDRFDSKYSQFRNKYIDFLEEHSYFGIEIIESEEILFNKPKQEEFYIKKADIQFLEYESEKFFKDFGYTEEEKVNLLLRDTHNHSINVKYLKQYITYRKEDSSFYTPAMTSFVEIVLEMGDLLLLTNEDIISVIDEVDIVRTRDFLIDFLNYVQNYEVVHYQTIIKKKKEADSQPAYPYDMFVNLARILFNSEYDKEHDLTIKALDKSKYIEMWMFLSCHYICGWRSSDICDRWVYPNLKDKNPFDIHIDSLKEDIANERISDEVYEKVASDSLKRIELAYNIPQKTGKEKLRAAIVPELRVFFGKLILIAEYHHITSGEGYMKSKRVANYRNWVICKEFFGEEMFQLTGKKALSSKRLNKSYLQSLEQAARADGTLIAHVVAAFARSHSNINTTAIYLKDHGLTGETAEVVLYMMMQRGIFGVTLYHALLSAYPQIFAKLSSKDKTALMEKIPISAYELETLGSSLSHSEKIIEEFTEGKTKEPTEILKAMFQIAQGRGQAKDSGVFCKRKALGYSCVNPTYESCIGNLCPYHIFTSNGMPALIKVIKEYQLKGLQDNKYKIALQTKIIPAFQDIINEIIKGMSKEEKAGVKRMIEEGMNG